MLCFCAAVLLALVGACSGRQQPTADAAPVADILHPALGETSGLARSIRHSDRLWAHNDSGGAAALHAFDVDGSVHGSVQLADASNMDWEDLASFERDGRAWLLVGDIGDNFAIRPVVTLYLLEEPELVDDTYRTTGPVRKIRFRYPGGARDAEALAVDAARNEALILSKRDIPAVLYSVSLDVREGVIQTAKQLGPVITVPQPSAADIERAPQALDWYWQPTAMDISGDRLAILTYRGLYLYTKARDGEWPDALDAVPRTFALGDVGEAEAVAFDRSGRRLFVTVERNYPPLYAFDVE